MSARMLRHARGEEGFVVATGIHAIDTVAAFMGGPERVLTRKVPGCLEGRFLYSASICLAGGAVTDIVISLNAGIDEETFEIHGHGYCIQIDRMCSSLRIFDGGRETFSWHAPRDTFHAGAVGDTEVFVYAIKERGAFRPDLRDALVSMKMAEAMESGGDVATDPEPQ